MASLKDIPLERKVKAFERVKAETSITEGKLVLLSEEHFDAALSFARDSFTKDEPINRAVKTGWFPELGEMWLQTFRCRLTLAVLEEHTGKIIALRGTRVINRHDEFDASEYDDPGFRILINIISYCDERAKFFDKYGVDEAFHLFGFGVDSAYRQRGLGGRLFKAAIDLLKYVGPKSFCIKGETSSNFSCRIYVKNNFDVLYDLPYEEYLEDDKQVICNMGEHKSLTIYGIKVEQ